MRVIITGGGTGGHLFPGIAIACGFKKKIPGCRIMFIGTRRLIDQKALTDYNFEIKSIDCAALKGMNIISKIYGLIKLPFAVFAAMRIINNFRPNLVFGVGGYVTGPVLLAAWLKKIPTCIHEQNSIPGLANRLTAKFVDAVFLSLPSKYNFPVGKTWQTGNPVRKEILAVADNNIKKKKEKKHILVLGGSQGAHKLNELMLTAAEKLADKYHEKLYITHQTGVKDLNMVQAGYRNLDVAAHVNYFFPDMATLYQQADLVISRAGATTLAELSTMGLPAILIPYPFAADNHQETNAKYYTMAGGALLFRESELSGKDLAQRIATLLDDPLRLEAMANNLKKLAKPKATIDIVAKCVQLFSTSTI